MPGGSGNDTILVCVRLIDWGALMDLSRYTKWLVICLAVMALLSCGKVKEDQDITLSGTVIIDEEIKAHIPLGPVFVAVLDQNPMDLEADAISDAVVAIHSVNKTDLEFSLTLSGKKKFASS